MLIPNDLANNIKNTLIQNANGYGFNLDKTGKDGVQYLKLIFEIIADAVGKECVNYIISNADVYTTSGDHQHTGKVT